MNPTTALAPEYRARTGHRYRDDDESFGAAPQVDYFSPAQQGGFEKAGHADTEVHADNFWAANNAWASPEPQNQGPAEPATAATQDFWTQRDSWAEGAAWNDGGAWDEDPWTPDNDGEWRQDETWGAEPEQPAAQDKPATRSNASPAMLAALRDAKRGGAHRVPTPPSALKGRAAVVAVAAGAVVAAGQAAFADTGQQPTQSVDYQAAGQVQPVAAQSMMADPAAAAPDSPDSPQMLGAAAPTALGDFSDMIENGQKFAENLAAQENAKLRPLFHTFASGTFTSGFGARWGVQHLGVDIAGPIGTPIYAVADGDVIDAGPASGFGMWVRVQHDDGTITVYGHVDTTTVSVGERVLAGDQIATIGNRGFSTGPHCHFEVWLNGADKIDPLPWLATRGISLGVQRD
ncbi:M23 family metallopeptidase [Nocardia callitridis]|uniref:M23ase beta-sheet core domain-containing protein n=1 Tax=Nocardia callitridis TaxID=648753 RepID=A0ABP9JW27_9NOCA